MSFSSHIFAKRAKVTVLSLLAALSLSNASTSSLDTLKGVVRYRVGDIFLQKAKGDSWSKKPIAIGTKVIEEDKIRTENESQATIAFPDGSILSIEENSLVVIKKLSKDNSGSQHAWAEIKSGRIQFFAQKQPIGNTLQFRTGTAVAAIRGTNGIVAAMNDDNALFSLASGRMELYIGNSRGEIVDSLQTAISIPKRFNRNEKFGIFKAPSSGNMAFVSDIFDMVERIMANAPDYNTWYQNIQDVLNASEKNLLPKIGEAQGRVLCEFDNLPDTTYASEFFVKGRCNTKTDLTINGEIFKDVSSVFEKKMNWSHITTPSAQRILITCKDKQSNLEFECGRLSSYYIPSKKDEAQVDSLIDENVTITSKLPLEADEDGYVNIEGTYKADELTSMFISIGKQRSSNIVKKNSTNEFSVSIPVNDEIGNWNETEATITYKNKNGEEKKIQTELSIDKSKKAVNLAEPQITSISTDSLYKCKTFLQLSNVEGDQIILTTLVDKSPIMEKRYTENNKITTALKPGKHIYKFIATDMAGNKQELTQNLGCYALSSGKISVTGSYHERLHIPPPPSNADPMIHKTLRFKVENIPGQNPDYLKRVTVKKGDKIIFQQQSQFEDISFTIPADLNYGMQNVFKIEVVLKNRSVLTATKIYEVR